MPSRTADNPVSHRLHPIFYLSAALLVIAGCATSAGERPRPRPQPIADDSDTQVPAAARQGTIRQRIVNIALSQWEHWGAQTVHIDREGNSCVTYSPLPAPEIAGDSTTEGIHEESSDDSDDENGITTTQCPNFPDGTGMEATEEGCRMAQNYWHIVGRQASCRQISTGTWAWSAVFISWVLRQAGLGESQFLASDAHSEYIVDARDGLLPDPAFTIETLPARPQPGDLICATRGIVTWDIDTPDKLRRRTPMHCDIVVDIDRHTLKAIGGNVQQSVSLSIVDLDGHGRLDSEPGAMRPWLLILRNRLP